MGLIGGVLQPLYGGFPVLLMSPAAFLQKPLRWLSAISRHRATSSAGPDFAYDLCVRHVSPEQRAELDLRSWEVAFTGAERVRAETLDRFATAFAPCGFRRETFFPCYGLAEATLIVSGGARISPPVVESVERPALHRNRVEPAVDGRDEVQRIVGCGHCLPDGRLVIVDPETRLPCPTERVGEIWVSSPSVAQGYWNRSEDTEQTFHARLASSPEGSFLRTGDLGFVKDGELFVVGRRKELIVIRGANHHPPDIERSVEQSNAAFRPAGGAAFSVEVAGEERLVVAHEVERSWMRRLDVEELAAAARRAVAEEHDLQLWTLLLLRPGSLPKTPNGKIRRHACRDRFLSGALELLGEWHAEARGAETGDGRQETGDGGRAAGLRSSVPGLPSAALPTSPVSPTEEGLQDWLLLRLAGYLEVAPEAIDVREPFAAYGLDSSVAVSITGELAEGLGRELDPTLFWEYPCVEAVARYLAAEWPSLAASIAAREGA
jgi:acyl-CoA synthetase (AMP-forming)/AMP-acid ligase II/acyl carrier protein